MCNFQAREMSDGDFIFEDKEEEEVWEHERRLRAKENATQAAGAQLPRLSMHAIASLLQDPPKQHRGLLHAAAQSQPEVRGALDPDLLDLDSAYTAQRGEALGPKGTSFRLRFRMPIMAQVLAAVHHLLTD